MYKYTSIKSIKKISGATPCEIIDSRGLRFFSGKKKKLKIFCRIEVLNCKTKKLHFWNFQKEKQKSKSPPHIFFSYTNLVFSNNLKLLYKSKVKKMKKKKTRFEYWYSNIFLCLFFFLPWIHFHFAFVEVLKDYELSGGDPVLERSQE